MTSRLARVRAPFLVVVLAAAAVSAVVLSVRSVTPDVAAGAAPASPSASPSAGTSPVAAPQSPASTPTEATSPSHPPRGLHGGPSGAVDGLTMFRGNPTRNWYGSGPLPAAPQVAWRYPDGGKLCSTSTVAGESTEWCGTGWTGQPVVWERPDGVTEVIVGTYDRAVHFIDAATGRSTRPAFRTGDLIKGSVTLDPDGYPLLYVGSRDNRYRVVALDREVPTELFALEAHPQGIWNNDWDGNGAIVDGLLHVGGEDSWFRILDLQRGYDADTGLVTVDPVVLAEVPGFDDELLAALPDRNVSIESSPLVLGDTVFVVNSGGLVSGFDFSQVRTGELPRIFRYWLGDDTDATLVADADGALYAAVELERFLPRSREVGQLVKLDPSRPDDPLVWSIPVPPREVGGDGNGGLWSTPAVYGDHLYATTHAGDLIVVDRHTGEITYTERIGYHEWASPAVVDDTLVVALCEAGGLRAYDLADPSSPTQRWEVSVPTGSCVESSPAIWGGGLYVGSRDGYVYGFR